MLGQMNIYGLNMVEQAIKRLQTFEPPEGYYLAFSGGKDSCVVKALADMAGVKYDAHYMVSSIDPPELVRFIKDYHPDVHFEKARYDDGRQITMRRLIIEKGMPPTRLVRYCCEHLKEGGGNQRFKLTGVRKAESAKRSRRGGLELADTLKAKDLESFDPDNPNQEMIHVCTVKAQRILNPIIDWGDNDVWEFLRRYNIPYCSLYDEGFKRLGCIGCPMARKEGRIREFARWPKFYQFYLKAFEDMEKARIERGQKPWRDGTGMSVMEWWMQEKK